jgi:hypothetical protein
MIEEASAWDLTESRLCTRMERWPGLGEGARAWMVGFWLAERMRDVTVWERERRSGVRSWETLPWPPRRRMWCGEDGILGSLFFFFSVWIGWV